MNTLAHLIEILYGRGGLSDFARDYDIDARRVRGMVASESGYPTPPYSSRHCGTRSLQNAVVETC